MAKKQYSDRQKAETLAVLDANNGHVSRTSKDTGIPRTTINEWIAGRTHPEVTEIRQEKKAELADLFEDFIRMTLGATTPEDVKAASLPQRFVAVGIAADKMQILRGRPNSIQEGSVSLVARIDQYTAAFVELADRPDAGDRDADGPAKRLDTANGQAKALPEAGPVPRVGGS